MWQITIVHIILISIIGVGLFVTLLYCIGFFEGGYIKRRIMRKNKNSRHTKIHITRFYILVLIILIIISFLTIRLNLRGGQ